MKREDLEKLSLEESRDFTNDVQEIFTHLYLVRTNIENATTTVPESVREFYGYGHPKLVDPSRLDASIENLRLAKKQIDETIDLIEELKEGVEEKK